MSVGIDGSFFNQLSATGLKNNGANKLENILKNDNLNESTDEELMNVCKSFEAYFVEQVFKEMKSTVSQEEEESEYMQYFGDMLTQKYAEDATKGQGLGIAQMLYESMKKE